MSQTTISKLKKGDFFTLKYFDDSEVDLNIAIPCHYTYASIEDAKRAINGKPLKYIPEEAEICGEKFWNRFK